MNYKRKNATHNLLCRHAVGRNGYDYYMACIPLKTMQDGRIKVLVFGDRNWKQNEEKQSVRYVDSFKVSIKHIK